MKQVFIADTHFGHDKFHSDNWQVKFWKKYNSINNDFILYHLGDLSFIHNHEYLEQIFQKFKENKHCKNIVLILGNHDDKANRYLQHGIIACDKMTITYKNKEIILTHEPIILSPIINIHGHLHTKEESHRDYYKTNENNILVETEKIYYIEELIKEND
jgi:calcineurin-like phosphoesterase family protein